jgi:molybdopterin converting factor small subunit
MTQTVTIRLFGAFRNYIPEPSVTLEVVEGSTAGVVRKNLEEYFLTHSENFDSKIITESMLATEDTVLELDDVVPEGISLAILPPVCGG